MSKMRSGKKSFVTKLFLGIGLLLLILVLSMSIVFIGLSVNSSIKTERFSNKVLVERISSQIDSLYEHLNIAATSITKNPTLKDIVIELNTMDKKDASQYVKNLERDKTVHALLGNMLFSPTISNVIFYNNKIPYFYYVGTYLDNEDKIREAMKDSLPLKMLNSRNVIYLGPEQSKWTDEDKKVISVIRNFSDNSTTFDSLVEVQVPAVHLDNICTQPGFKDEKEIFILDENNVPIYPENKYSIFSEKEVNEIIDKVKNKEMTGNSLSVSYMGKELKGTGFTTLLISNNKYLKKQIIYYVLTALIMGGAIMAVLLFAIKKIIEMVTSPLNSIIDHIENLSNDETTKLELPENSLNEFEILNSSLDQMVERIKTSSQKIYELELRESKANLAALQAKINPHFMYNALNSISAASEVYGSEMTTTMCKQFSEIMEYVTNTKEKVTLSEELIHTENYLKFMALSNEDNFRYELNCDNKLYGLVIPKLSIQPLVENCFKHAFSMINPPWIIKINCMLIDDTWQITIDDNGPGFKNRDIKINSDYSEMQIHGLGLQNTFARFKLIFGDSFTYHLDNMDPGARITLKGKISDDKDICS